MSIDRDETLRKAEKLLRQGRLDAAIEEYARVAQETPDDLATNNKLGELYQRAGQVHTAITYYRRVADQWLHEGLDAKAAGHYKKILKLRPDDEAAMLQLVEALTHLGQLDEAKTFLRSALERRQAAGDRAGVEDLVLRLADLDPNDFDARLMGLRVKLSRGHSPELGAELRQAITELDQRGRPDEADALLRELIRLDPADIQARVRVARTAMGRGDIETVRSVLPPKPAESKHYDIVWMAAELDVIAGDLAGGRSLLMRSLTIDRVRGTTDVLALAERLRKKNPDATWVCIEALVEDRAEAKDFGKAADHLKRFLKQTPGHVPALLRLVEICVDGDLDSDLTLAQALLADAYLQVGEAAQARVIAEDLLSREPRSAAHRERLKRALIALGEKDPEAVIAEHLTFVADIEDKPEPPPVDARSPEPTPPPVAEPDAPAPPHTEPTPTASTPPPAAPSSAPAPAEPAGQKPVKSPAPTLKPPAWTVTPPSAASPPPPQPPTTFAPVAPGAPAAPSTPAGASDTPRPSSAAPVQPPPSSGPAPAKPAFEGPNLGLDDDEPDFGSASAASDAIPSHDDAPDEGPDIEEPAWPGEGSVMFEPDLGGALGVPDDLLDAPTSSEVAGATIGDPSTSTSHPQDEGAKGHHGSRGAVPDQSADEGDLEVDLTGALDAIGKPSVSINDALGKAVSRSGRPDGPQNAAGPVPGTTGAGRALAPTAAQNVENVEPIAGEIEGQIVGRIEGQIDAVSDAFAADALLEPSETELEAAFDGLIEQVAEEFAQLPRHDQSFQLMRMAETYQTAGMIDEARAALEQAAADRRYRFQATAALGRLYRRLNDPTEAVRWLEAATQAVPPTADDRRALLYDLADTLERTGDATRALANWLDLLAEQDDYRDVRSRIDRLVRTQS